MGDWGFQCSADWGKVCVIAIQCVVIGVEYEVIDVQCVVVVVQWGD